MESDTKDGKSDGESTIRASRDPTRALELIRDPFFGSAASRPVGRLDGFPDGHHDSRPHSRQDVHPESVVEVQKAQFGP